MDWCIETTVPGALDCAEREVLDHLARHASHEELVDMAGPIVREALADARGSGAAWLSLDWEDTVARMTIRPLEAGDWPAEGPAGEGLSPLAPGVALANEAVPELARRAAPGGVDIGLGVVRPREWDLDPQPNPQPGGEGGELSREDFLALVAGFLSHGVEGRRTQDELAAWAGATIGLTGEEAFRQRAGVEGTLSAAQVGDAILDVLQRAGGDFFLVEQEGRRLVLANRRCPFGSAVLGSPSLCRMTSALAGGIAARSFGEARVTLDERLALGDHQCRLVLDLGPSAERDTSHHYTWPPAGWPDLPDAPDPAAEYTKGFLVSLTLRLPRDHLSVPVVRHLTSHALEEVGVLDAISADVELALAEACGNVLTHAGPGDVYDVSITIGPQTCDIRVTDVGRGFDYASLNQKMARTDAESGRGVALMHALMDQVRFTSEPERGTIVHLVKRLEFDDNAPTRRLMLAAVAEEDQRRSQA